MKKLKKIINLLFLPIILLISFNVNAQNILVGKKFNIAAATTVVMKNLPIPSKKSNIKNNNKIANEEEDLPKARKNKLAQTNPVFIPSLLKTIKKSAGFNNQIQSEIFESPCIGYQGILQENGTSSSSNGIIPADVGGAVGFDHLFLTLNNRFRIQNKNGSILREEDQEDPTGFWASAGFNISKLFDPKIIYDPYKNRWVYTIASGGKNSTTSAIYLAVSSTADPMGAWTIYSIDTDVENDNWADYPSVGFNKNWITINVNMIGIDGTNGKPVNRTFILNKLQLYAQASSVNVSYYDAETSPFRYWTICPAMVYDANYNDMWCATNDDVDDNDIRFFKITGGPSNPTMTEEGYVSSGSNWSGTTAGDLAPQAGLSAKLDVGYDWVQSAIWRNGKLYIAQTLLTPDGGSPNTASLQLIACDPDNENIDEAVRFITDVNNMYAYPNFVVNKNGDWIISCAKFTSASFPSAATIVRRNGTNTFIETVYKSGEDSYLRMNGGTKNRWGDYTTASIDPSDDNSVWVAGQYALPRVTGTSRWATWWGKVCSGTCDNITYLNTLQLTGTMRKWEASNIVYASSILQAGTDIKLDAGVKIVLQPGFKATEGSRVRTYLEGCGGVQ
jgi:hypothetical protein